MKAKMKGKPVKPAKTQMTGIGAIPLGAFAAKKPGKAPAKPVKKASGRGY